jgi:hypothetical protein
MRSVDLTSTFIEYPGGRSVALLGVVDSWASQVLRMFRESLDPPGPADDAWGADDLVGALLARDRIEGAIVGVGDDSVKPLPTLAVADELFRVFTVADDDGLMSEVQSATPGEQWWWKRVPVTGPIAQDLNRWRENRLARERTETAGAGDDLRVSE